MNSAIFWRLVWKEYRQQQSLWIAIALAGLLIQIATLIFCSLNGLGDVPDRLFAVALSLPILYSLGCGASLFAGEHEAGTYAFQQSLPVAAKRVFFAKLTFAVASALLLFPLMWLIAYGMTSWTLPTQDWHIQLWSGGVVATLEVMAWGVLGSLLLRRVLPAAIASGVVAVVLGYASLILLVTVGRAVEFRGQDYVGTLPVRIGFALLALAVATKFGTQWFNERPNQWRAKTKKRRRTVAAPTGRGVPLRRTILLRLMWHEWRQARTTILWCVGGHFVVATWIAMSEFGREAYVLFLPALATFFGASVFAADQRQQQYTFFSEHGVRPGFVWLSRQAVWGSVLALLAIAAILLQFTAGALSSHDMTNLYVAIGFTILMFSSGQLCSILIRSHIVAIFTAAFCSAILFIWTAFTTRLGVQWLISSFPLPLIFLGVSWLYIPKWIQQRNTWHVRFMTAATIIVPLLAIVTATGTFRVLEVPAVVISIDTQLRTHDVSPTARETAAMYRQASQLTSQLVNNADGSTSIRSRDDAWKQNIKVFIAASQRDTCRFHHWEDTNTIRAFDATSLTRAVLAEAAARTDEGDVEGAAELHHGLLRLASHFYQQQSEATYRMHAAGVENALFAQLPEWANHEAVSADRLTQAVGHLQMWFQDNDPNWEQSILEHRRNVTELIALNDVVMAKHYQMQTAERGALKVIGMLLPWERWRMSRVVDVYTETELQGMKAIRERTPRIGPRAQSQLPWDVELELTNGRRELHRSSEVEPWIYSTVFVNSVSPLFAPTYVAWENQLFSKRNAVQLQLAAIAWRKQHGSLPESLDKFSQTPFEVMPLDPYTKRPFVYMPNGVEEEVWPDEVMYGMGGGMMGIEDSSDETTEYVVPKPKLVRSAPFLWSPGEDLRYYPHRSNQPGYSPMPNEFGDQQGNTLNEVSLLHNGIRYVIPTDEKADPEQQPSDSSDNTEALPTDE